MISDKLDALTPSSLPYPRNEILAELIDILPKIIPLEQTQSLESYIDFSDAGSAYTTIVNFINTKLTAQQRQKFNNLISTFCQNAIYLDTPEDEEETFRREIMRTFNKKL